MHSYIISALLATFVLVEVVYVTGKKGDSSGYRTIYECEGKTLNIVCNEGIIHLIRANYGRFSISICNDHGNLDWRVNCMSHHSFLIMQERCNFKPNCSVNVSSSTFHDPCPGTLKYLEVQYHCGTGIPLVTMATTTPLPLLKATSPNNATGVPNIGKIQTATYRAALSSVLPTSATTPLLKTSTASSNPVLPTTSSFNGSIIIREYSSTTKRPPTTTTSTSTSLALTSSARPSVVFTTTVYSNEDYCSPTYSRGIHWVWTKSGETATSKCPDGASGIAKWSCKNSPAHWSPETPDLLQCHSLWLENLKERLQNGDSIISVTSELAVMSSAKPLFSDDLKIISSLIQQALYKSVNSMENFLDTWHRYHVLRELLQSSVQTLSNILETKQESAWKDLNLNEKKMVISTLIERLDESAFLLAETSSDDGSFSLVKSNVWLSLQVLKSKNQKSLSFPIFSEISSEDEGMYWLNMQDSIVLPQEAIEEYAKNGYYKVVFCVFNKLSDYLVPGSISHLLPEHSSENISRIINSRIIGASLDKTGNIKLNQPVIITLKHLIEGNVTNPVCVYWDFHIRDWSAQGCWIESNNRSHTVCLCDHLTNFALVMDLQTNFNPAQDTNLMHMVITTGCIISIIALLLTLTILFMLSLDLSEDSTFIHRNMFLCLLLSEIVFLGGIKQTNHHIACSIIAGSLQYLFLVTFSWMFFECFHQYMTLIRSSEAKKSKSWWYYGAAYIIPGIITGISAIIDPASYGTNYYCWLQADNYFVFSFVGPAISILFGGSVFLCIALCMFYHNISNTTAIKGKDNANFEKYRSWNKRSIFLILLLTLTWTSALVYINGESMALACTFSILNSVQGISILWLYCFQNEKVKDDVRKVLSHDFCFKQRKQQEPQITSDVVINSNTSGDCDPQEFWTLPKEKISSSTNVASEISTNAPTRSSLAAADEDVRSPNAFWMVRGNSNWKPAFYAGKNGIEEQDTVSLNLHRYQASNPKDHSHQFFVTPESNGQFLDHIYETIDDDALPDEDEGKISFQACQRFPPPENYYGDHSDLSQHSSSSYGYDQQPLIIIGLQNGQNVSQKPYTMPRDSHINQHSDDSKQFWERNQNQSLRRQRSPSDKPILRKACDENPCHFRSEKQLHVPKGSPEVWETPLPDLLQSPPDSTVVLAVLDGDKVVNRIQQEDVIIKPQYKLSTYC